MDENLKNKNCIPNLKICLLSHKSPRAAAKRDPALNHRFSAAASLGPSLIPSSFPWWPPGTGSEEASLPSLRWSPGRRSEETSLPLPLRWSPRTGSEEACFPPSVRWSPGTRSEDVLWGHGVGSVADRVADRVPAVPLLLVAGRRHGAPRRHPRPATHPPLPLRLLHAHPAHPHRLVRHRIIPPRRRHWVRHSSLTPLSSTWFVRNWNGFFWK
jgi:hypothetical protein